MTSTRLSVWWATALVGTLDRTRQGMRFTYAGLNVPMISVAMPPRTGAYGDRLVRPFFNGLLPEGEARQIIAYDLGLGSAGGDDLRLLAAIGRDCAGALTIVPADASVEAPDSGTYQPLSSSEVAARVRTRPERVDHARSPRGRGQRRRPDRGGGPY